MVQLASGTQFGAHWVRVLALVLGLWTLVGTTQAAALKIGLAAEVTTVDPHFFNTGPHNAFLHHVFDSLVDVDADGRLISGLAESWVAVDETTWEFRLRKAVKFHDGSAFTADDAVFSLERAMSKTSNFAVYTQGIDKVVRPSPAPIARPSRD